MHGSEDFRRVLDFSQTGACHLEYGYFGRGSETVLDAAQNAVRVACVSLELQDNVDDVLQDLGACYSAVLGDVAYEDDRNAAFLRKAKQSRRAFPDLGDRRGGGIYALGVYSLYRVYHQQVGMQLPRAADDILHDCLSQYGTAFLAIVLSGTQEPHGSELDLSGRLFSGDIQGAQALAAEGNLQGKGGLSYSRLSSQEDHRAGDDAAPKDSLHLLVAYQDPAVPLHRDVFQGYGIGFGKSHQGAGRSLA